jgi:hypothetical protein
MDNPDLETEIDGLETQLAVLQAYRDIKVEKLHEALNDLENLFMEYNINISDITRIRLNIFQKYG